MTTVESSESTESSSSRFGALSTVGKVRFVAFTLAVLALLALNVVMTPPEVLAASFVGWFGDPGVHQVHDMTVAALLWTAIVVPAALLLYHPTRRVNTVLAPIVLVVPVMVMAYLAGSFLFVGFVIGSTLALLALLLHPAGRSLVRFDRVDSVDRRIAALLAVGAIPLLGYAGLELVKQFGPVDDHVLFVHFGGMAIAAVYVALMGTLAVVRERDWRFAAWSAGLIAAFVGLASVVFPGVESSLGIVGGVLLFLWAVAFVAGVEYSRRSDPSEGESMDEIARKPEPA